jgi:hypothetical protein
MTKPDAVFICIGTYPDEAAARAGYGVVKDLHAAGVVGTYDAAVVTNDDAGNVYVSKDEVKSRRGRVGRRCRRHPVPRPRSSAPPWPARRWGVGGHLWRGVSGSDVKESGELIVWLTPPVADRRPTEGRRHGGRGILRCQSGQG